MASLPLPSRPQGGEVPHLASLSLSRTCLLQRHHKSGPMYAKQKKGFCQPSVVKKNGNRPRRPTNPSNEATQTQRPSTFNAAIFSWTNTRESREDDIENEKARCVCVGRLGRFQFFFTTDGPKLRQKKSSKKTLSSILGVGGAIRVVPGRPDEAQFGPTRPHAFLRS